MATTGVVIIREAANVVIRGAVVVLIMCHTGFAYGPLETLKMFVA